MKAIKFLCLPLIVLNNVRAQTPAVETKPMTPLAATNVSEIAAYIPPFNARAAGLTPLFDGKTLNGWVGDPACWQVVDGAIVGVKGNQNVMTRDDYDNFRIILSSIQVKETSNHQGVGFWPTPIAFR